MNKYQEVLDNLCKHCQELMSQIPVETKKGESYDIHHCGHVMCPWRTISNDYCDDYMTLKELVVRYENESKPKFIFDGNGNAVDVAMESISSCVGTMDTCEQYCPKCSSCSTFALANDLLVEYERNAYGK